VGLLTHYVRWRSLAPPGKGEIWGSNPQPKHAIIANCRQTVSPMLPHEEYKTRSLVDLPLRFRLLQNYFGFVAIIIS